MEGRGPASYLTRRWLVRFLFRAANICVSFLGITRLFAAESGGQAESQVQTHLLNVSPQLETLPCPFRVSGQTHVTGRERTTL